MKINFDSEQRCAIEHGRGPMLVWAGAGTGKTLVLVERAARLLREKVCAPQELVAITYTDNAAAEIRSRVALAAGSSAAGGITVTTFHAHGYGMLARAGRKFEILDETDMWIYLRQRVAELPLRDFIKAADLGAFLKDLIDFFRRCHDELITPQDYFRFLARVESGELPLPRVSKASQRDALTRAQALERCRELGATFEKVESMLRADNFGSFGHMLSHAVQLLERDSEWLERECRRARFLLVDEFQDSNYAQVRLCQLLAGAEQNVFAVGDPDQAIYRFRGASTAAFEQFVKVFPGATLVRLGRNHRSTMPILACAHALVARNPEALGHPPAAGGFRREPLASARQQQAEREGRRVGAATVEIACAGTNVSEAQAVAESIAARRRREGCSWSSFAVLYRSHAHREEMLAELGERSIPVNVTGVNILETPEFRDLLACLRAMFSAADAVAVLRVAALPRFHFEGEELRALVRQKHFAEALRSSPAGRELLAALDEARDRAAKATAAAATAPAALTNGGSESQKQNQIPALAAFDAAVATFGIAAQNAVVRAFRDFIARWERKPYTQARSLAEFLSYLELFLQAEGQVPVALGGEDAVQLMSAHAAKGLEFRHVFVLRATSGSFPANYREPLFEFPAGLRPPDSLATADNKEIHLQEERRLFYVAMTRARDSLSLLAAHRRVQKEPIPAGYLRELGSAPAVRTCLQVRQLPEPLFTLRAAAQPATPLAQWLYAELPPAVADRELSASALSTYQRCPLRFKLERAWGLPAQPTGPLQFGDAMHKALKLFGERAAAGQPVTLEELNSTFLAAFSSAALDHPLQRRLYEARARTQLESFLAAQTASPPQVISAERAFVHNLGGVNIRGRVDRLDRISGAEVAVIDYKTGVPRTQEYADESLQLSLYAVAVAEKFGFTPVRLVFYNLETGGEVVTARTRQQLETAAAEVAALAQGIAEGRFDPNPGHHCRSCPYREVCPTQEKILFSIQPAAAESVN